MDRIDLISLPVHTAVWSDLESGTLLVPVAVQLFVSGLYLPPVSNEVELLVPPQMIIRLPVQTAV
jgi:hypothetical protein